MTASTSTTNGDAPIRQTCHSPVLAMDQGEGGT
jgi:hypothetical protein